MGIATLVLMELFQKIANVLLAQVHALFAKIVRIAHHVHQTIFFTTTFVWESVL
jgi:hypothetical protein